MGSHKNRYFSQLGVCKRKEIAIMMRIIVKHNDTPIKTYQFDSDIVTVGRLATNSIPINSMGVSRHHLKIERNQSTGLMDVKDLGSLNGCYIDSKRIDIQAIQSATDVVLGKYSLHIEFTDAVAQPVPPRVTTATPAIPENPVELTSSPTPIVQQIVEQTEPTAINEPDSTPLSTQSAAVTSEHSEALILDEIGKVEEETVPESNFVFSKSTKADEDLAAELEPPTVNAVLIDLKRQVIFKITKSMMVFGSDKAADIFVESGVFSSDKLATITVENDIFTIHKGNGKLKVNGKKSTSQTLVHKDKIKIDGSEFSFMIKDN